MKRLLLVCLMILCLVPAGAISDTQVTMAEEAAREYAMAVLSMPEIACADADGMSVDLQRDGDCWICHASSGEKTGDKFVLIFDDNRCIHRFQDLHCKLPDELYRECERPLSEEDSEFLQDAMTAAASWLVLTRGWGFDSFFLDQMISEDNWLFSIDELSSYIVISRTDGACVIRAYGMMTGSHGAYGDGVTKTQAVDLARQAVNPNHRLTVLLVAFSTSDLFTTGDGL